MEKEHVKLLPKNLKTEGICGLLWEKGPTAIKRSFKTQ